MQCFWGAAKKLEPIEKMKIRTVIFLIKFMTSRKWNRNCVLEKAFHCAAIMISPGQTHGKDEASEGTFPLKLVLVLGRLLTLIQL